LGGLPLGGLLGGALPGGGANPLPGLLGGIVTPIQTILPIGGLTGALPGL